MDEKELMALKEELERLKGENEALKAKAKTAYGKLAFKVSEVRFRTVPLSNVA